MPKFHKLSDPNLLLATDDSGNPIAIKSDAGKQAGVVAQYPTYSSLPSASSFGVGVAQVADTGKIYKSDGKSFIPLLENTFKPTDLSGLQLWVDVSEGVSKSAGREAVNAGDVVTIVQDKSGKRHTLTVTGSPTITDINGTQAIALNGSSQYISSEAFVDASYATSGFTMFAVGVRTGASTDLRVLSEIAGAASCYLSHTPSSGVSEISIGALTQGFAAARGSGGVYMGAYGGDNEKYAAFSLNQALSTPADTSQAVMSSSDVAYLKPMSGTWGQSITSAIVIGQHAGGFFWEGKFGEFLLFNRLLTSDEIAKVRSYLTVKWGYDLPSVLCIGDSITSGTSSTGGTTQSQFSGTTNYPNQLKNLLGGESAAYVRTFASPGLEIGDLESIIDKYKISTVFYSPYSLKKQYAVLHMGVNDLAHNNTGANAYKVYKRFATKLSQLGYRVITCTILPTQSLTTAPTNAEFETQRIIFNNLLAADYQNFAYAFVDNRANGPLTDSLNTTYFNADKLHLTDAGYGVLAASIRSAITL